METIERFTTEILPREKVRILIPYNPEFAHYNAAVIGGGEDVLYILARKVPLADIQPGIPDRGNLVVYRSTPNGVEEIRKLDLSPESRVSNWEDPRAFTSGKDVLIGLTAIRAIDNKPVAATIRGQIINNDFQMDISSLTTCFADVGKNTTPISNGQLLFRREGYRHSLELIEIITDPATSQSRIKTLKTINFPKKSWCEWQIGTQAQMLPNGILPIHGVNRFNLGKGNGYAYSLGLAQLDENMNVIRVSDAPLFTRESFKNILPMDRAMDISKSVVYCCGYSFDGKTVKFAINIGDLMTVEVEKEFSELQDMLR